MRFVMLLLFLIIIWVNMLICLQIKVLLTVYVLKDSSFWLDIINLG